MNRLTVSILLAMAVAGLAGCSKSDSQSFTAVPSAAAKAPGPAPVAQQPPATYIASGPIVVEDQVDVAAQRAGVIYSLRAEVGQQVRKGELLGTLDDRQLRAECDAADGRLHTSEANLKDWEAETNMAEADYRRAEAMHKAELTTQENLDHARYKMDGSKYEIEKGEQEVRTADANLRALRLELEKTQIRAPFDGVIARRYVRVGQAVAVGDRLFWVTAVRPLRVKFTLPERYMGKLRKGQTLNVTSADDPGANHPAKVIQVSPVIDPSSGTFEAVAEIVGTPQDLHPGMTANIRFDRVQ